MAFINMVQRLSREIPGMNIEYAKTLTNEALKLIYQSHMWSFQLKEAGWLSPGLLFAAAGAGGAGQSTGTISATAGSSTITGSASASAQWLAYINAQTQPALTKCQIRVPYYSLYNIVSIDISTPTAIVFTLDRPWEEPTNATYSYMIYQAYFPAPYAMTDWKRWFTVRNMTYNQSLDYWSKKRGDIDVIDAQRVVFNYPQYVVPYEIDARPGSDTLGYMLYELWPHPLSQWPFALMCQRLGPTLSAQSDTVPAPLTEEMVLWRAKEVSYLWKEAQKGEDMQRGAGANWQFLAQAASQEYDKVAKEVKRQDREACNLYMAKVYRRSDITGRPFATINNQLNIGTFGG